MIKSKDLEAGIKKELLLEDIAYLAEDFWNASMKIYDDKLFVKFNNEQTFVIEIAI